MRRPETGPATLPGVDALRYRARERVSERENRDSARGHDPQDVLQHAPDPSSQAFTGSYTRLQGWSSTRTSQNSHGDTERACMGVGAWSYRQQQRRGQPAWPPLSRGPRRDAQQRCQRSPRARRLGATPPPAPVSCTTHKHKHTHTGQPTAQDARGARAQVSGACSHTRARQCRTAS